MVGLERERDRERERDWARTGWCSAKYVKGCQGGGGENPAAKAVQGRWCQGLNGYGATLTRYWERSGSNLKQKQKRGLLDTRVPGGISPIPDRERGTSFIYSYGVVFRKPELTNSAYAPSQTIWQSKKMTSVTVIAGYARIRKYRFSSWNFDPLIRGRLSFSRRSLTSALQFFSSCQQERARAGRATTQVHRRNSAQSSRHFGKIPMTAQTRTNTYPGGCDIYMMLRAPSKSYNLESILFLPASLIGILHTSRHIRLI